MGWVLPGPSAHEHGRRAPGPEGPGARRRTGRAFFDSELVFLVRAYAPRWRIDATKPASSTVAPDSSAGVFDRCRDDQSIPASPRANRRLEPFQGFGRCVTEGRRCTRREERPSSRTATLVTIRGLPLRPATCPKIVGFRGGGYFSPAAQTRSERAKGVGEAADRNDDPAPRWPMRSADALGGAARSSILRPLPTP